MMQFTPTTQARMDLGESLRIALSNAEEYQREAEAQHAKVTADPFFTDADRRASLTEVLLSHRVLALLRPAAELAPHVPEETPVVVPTAHRVVHPPALGWSRAPVEVMGGTIGGLARALHTMAGCKHFDVHVRDETGGMQVFVDGDTNASWSLRAVGEIFGDKMPMVSSLPKVWG